MGFIFEVDLVSYYASDLTRPIKPDMVEERILPVWPVL